MKRVVGGPVSNWLHDNVIPGTRIAVEAPLGSFTIAGRKATKYLFLSAGSGITPVMSMTRTLYDLGSDADILFIHSARTPADIIFRRELDAIASMTPNIRVGAHMRRRPPVRTLAWASWPTLTSGAAGDLAPDLTERVTYTCGPSAYMASVRHVLAETGYDMRNYHEESFSFESLPVAEQAAADPLHQVGETDEPSAADRRPGDVQRRVRPHRQHHHRPGGPVRPGRRARRRHAPGVLLQPGHVRNLQDHDAGGPVDMQHNGGIRPKEVAAQQDLDLLLQTPE